MSAENVTVKPGKSIEESTAKGFSAKLISIIENGADELFVDMGEVEEIDPVGLGVLIAAQNSLKKTGGVMTLTNVSPDIFDLFKVMRLEDHFEIQSYV